MPYRDFRDTRNVGRGHRAWDGNAFRSLRLDEDGSLYTSYSKQNSVSQIGNNGQSKVGFYVQRIAKLPIGPYRPKISISENLSLVLSSSGELFLLNYNANAGGSGIIFNEQKNILRRLTTIPQGHGRCIDIVAYQNYACILVFEDGFIYGGSYPHFGGAMSAKPKPNIALGEIAGEIKLPTDKKCVRAYVKYFSRSHGTKHVIDTTSFYSTQGEKIYFETEDGALYVSSCQNKDWHIQYPDGIGALEPVQLLPRSTKQSTKFEGLVKTDIVAYPDEFISNIVIMAAPKVGSGYGFSGYWLNGHYAAPEIEDHKWYWYDDNGVQHSYLIVKEIESSITNTESRKRVTFSGEIPKQRTPIYRRQSTLVTDNKPDFS
jgi:hypothetical protein